MQRIPPPVSEAQGLSRAEAERIARRLYYTDDITAPALVELLLLCDNPKASQGVRRAADAALDRFDPWEDFLPEPPAVRAFRWAVYAYDLEERKKAMNVLLAHLSRWE